MSNLGSAQTSKFSIGTAELRIGPLASAGQLTQAHSVGLIDNATVEISQNSVDLLGGFPQKIVDTAITSQEASLTATLREYSRRNIDLMLGNPVANYLVEAATDVVTLDAGQTAGTTVNLPTGQGTNWTAGDTFVLFSVTDPGLVNFCRVESVSVDALTLDAGTPTTFSAAIGDILYRAQENAVGAISEANYFSVMLVSTQRGVLNSVGGRPAVFNFWKAAISAGMTLGSNAEDFASTEFALKILEPSAGDYGAGGSLNHLANIIPTNPYGLYAGGADQ